MKRHLAILFCTALLTAVVAINVHAQGADAAHVAAAKAASTKAGNAGSASRRPAAMSCPPKLRRWPAQASSAA